METPLLLAHGESTVYTLLLQTQHQFYNNRNHDIKTYSPLFNGLFSRKVNQKGKPFWIALASVDQMQSSALRSTEITVNQASTSSLKIFYRLDALV